MILFWHHLLQYKLWEHHLLAVIRVKSWIISSDEVNCLRVYETVNRKSIYWFWRMKLSLIIFSTNLMNLFKDVVLDFWIFKTSILHILSREEVQLGNKTNYTYRASSVSWFTFNCLHEHVYCKHVSIVGWGRDWWLSLYVFLPHQSQVQGNKNGKTNKKQTNKKTNKNKSLGLLPNTCLVSDYMLCLLYVYNCNSAHFSLVKTK